MHYDKTSILYILINLDFAKQFRKHFYVDHGRKVVSLVLVNDQGQVHIIDYGGLKSSMDQTWEICKTKAFEYEDECQYLQRI